MSSPLLYNLVRGRWLHAQSGYAKNSGARVCRTAVKRAQVHAYRWNRPMTAALKSLRVRLSTLLKSEPAPCWTEYLREKSHRS